MKNIVIVFMILGFCVLCLGGCVWTSYNGLVNNEESVRNSWSQVQNVYQRRVDLVSQLTNVVSAGSAQELAVFKTLRDQAASLKSDLNGSVPNSDVIQKISAFDQALNNFLVYVADNPEIASMELYKDFQTQIEGSENRVSIARKDYNDTVETYRLSTRRFPSSLFASLFGFQTDRFKYFEATEAAQTAPEISFPTPNINN